MKNDKKERKKTAGDFSIFICAAKSASQIAPRLRHGTDNDRDIFKRNRKHKALYRKADTFAG